MAELDSLRNHLVDQLADLLDAERQLTRALGRMAAMAATSSLRTAFEHHLTDTRVHVRRLERALTHMGASADSRRADGMMTLLDESMTITNEAAEGPIRDAVLIATARKVEHYAMAGYSTAHAFAHVLGLSSVVRLVAQSLKEEKTADQILARIANGSVNDAAAAEWNAEMAHSERPLSLRRRGRKRRKRLRRR